MQCSEIAVIKGREFFEPLTFKGGGRGLPLSGTVELTYRCNLRCRHCYINVPSNDAHSKGEELTAGQWCGLIDQMVDAGCLWLAMTGGEVLLRPDFLEIYRHARARGILVIIFTNGTLITERIANQLSETPPRNIEISLYGMSEETCERFTGVPGSHGRCMRGIDLLLERRVPLALKTVVTTLNRHELPAIKAFAEGLGVDFRFDAEVNLRLDGGKSPAAVRLPADEVVALDRGDSRRSEQWSDMFRQFFGILAPSKFRYQCGAGTTAFHVDASGALSPCLLSRSQRYDLLKGSFEEAWVEFIPEVRAQKRTGQRRCDACAIAPLCGQCPGWAELESGDPERPVDFLCERSRT